MSSAEDKTYENETRGSSDLEFIIDKQKKEIFQLKKDKDILNEEVQATNIIELNHKELNGELRKEINELKLANKQAVENVKKEADKLMVNHICKHQNAKELVLLDKELKEVKEDNKKLAKQIEDLKKEAKDMLLYP